MNNTTLQDLFEITNTDDLLDINLYTQAVYFHLAMRADEKDLIANYKSVLRMLGVLNHELVELIEKKFLKKEEGKLYLVSRKER
ncbi:hypothetical protein SAMN00017477_0985 [Peptoniphilus asaccharolyticus DSM 20463]|uniref:Uncharacterized protein n=1 Tax=Peptoniphilus asaccharolyticus DSM 20463 TaxID=573058 RepID=A0A1W1V1M6_PEPAS|nr:hypothetical protein [Peptoniphilus asaccharolyticus]MBL7575481.1 hypothetical protein [Peptoniphilus asaccharolyticus]SMB86924.1 hypothetical protein SAMN00017477_0985 [Peptoniphilus asaccharolyticus DSM 20463]